MSHPLIFHEITLFLSQFSCHPIISLPLNGNILKVNKTEIKKFMGNRRKPKVTHNGLYFNRTAEQKKISTQTLPEDKSE